MVPPINCWVPCQSSANWINSSQAGPNSASLYAQPSAFECADHPTLTNARSSFPYIFHNLDELCFWHVGRIFLIDTKFVFSPSQCWKFTMLTHEKCLLLKNSSFPNYSLLSGTPVPLSLMPCNRSTSSDSVLWIGVIHATTSTSDVHLCATTNANFLGYCLCCSLTKWTRHTFRPFVDSRFLADQAL